MENFVKITCDKICLRFDYQVNLTIFFLPFRGAMGIMLVYDITNSKSFDNIAKWLRNIQEHANEDVEKMILGNKCDMEDKRVIPKERGESIARENGIRFLETSAKTNVNIDKAFIELSESILDKTIDVQEPRQPLPPANPQAGRQCCTN